MQTETRSSRQAGPRRVSLGAAAALAVAVLGAAVVATAADRSAHAHRAEAQAVTSLPASPAAMPDRSAAADPSLPSALSVFEHRMVLPEELPAQF
jgi:hypothetical protein